MPFLPYWSNNLCAYLRINIFYMALLGTHIIPLHFEYIFPWPYTFLWQPLNTTVLIELQKGSSKCVRQAARTHATDSILFFRYLKQYEDVSLKAETWLWSRYSRNSRLSSPKNSALFRSLFSSHRRKWLTHFPSFLVLLTENPFLISLMLLST